MIFVKLIFIIILSSCTNLMYYPDSWPYYFPDKQTLDFTEHYFKTEDNLTLHGWLITDKIANKKKYDSRGLILHLHGNAANLTAHFYHFTWLTQQGYDIFIPDYRGYGKSQGRPSPKGLYLDAQAALDYAHDLKNSKKYSKFIVVGQSLGGSIVLKLLSEEKNKKEKIDLVILDSTFRSNSQVGAAILRRHWLTFIFSPLSYVLMQDNYNASIRDLENWRYPTLCLTHLKDPVVPSYLTQEIYHHLKNAKSKWLWLRDDTDVGHINSFLTQKAEFKQQLNVLLKQL